MSTITPNNNNFIIENSEKSTKVLLNDFKNHVNNTINFFKDKYIISFEVLHDNCNRCMTDGCLLLTRINFYLRMLEEKDKNQTNKYEYMKCIDIIQNGNRTMNLLNLTDLITFSLHENETRILNLAKLSKDAHVNLNLIDEYNINSNKISIIQNDHLINQFNCAVNDMLLNIIRIKEIIKDIYIGDNLY